MNRLAKLKFLLIGTTFPLLLHSVGFDSTYQKITDTKRKKAAFISLMLPKIHQVNYKIQKERHFIQKFFNKKLFLNSSRSRKDIKKLNDLAQKYRINDIYDEQRYLKRIDQVPVSLVLAQGALESAWGKSRFVQVANNVFGQWTYSGRGIVPKNRAADKTHKIKTFDTINESIEAYMLNLNRNRAYREFRNEREKHTSKRQLYSGLEAANTMENYSGIGEEYNTILKKMIKKNRFGQFDNRAVQKEL